MSRRVGIERSAPATDRAAHPVPITPAAPEQDGASLAQVAAAGLRSRVSEVRGSASWRRVAGWSGQPVVTTRGTVLLAAAIVVVMLGQAVLTVRGPATPIATSAPPLARPAPPGPRPVTRAPAAPMVAAGLGEPPQVVGIVGRLPGDAVVLVRGVGGTHGVAVGGVADDWTLVELSPTDAVFERHGARRTVELPAIE